MKTVCVFVGAKLGKSQLYVETIKTLAKEISNNHLHLLYGGGRLGLMGVLADTVIENGGKVTGIIPRNLYDDEAHLGLTHLHLTETIQDRKLKMLELADAFIACPGGLGTLEEICEVWNGLKINFHQKSYQKQIILLNINNYFDKLIEFIQYTAQEKFTDLDVHKSIIINNDPVKIVKMLVHQFATTDVFPETECSISPIN